MLHATIKVLADLGEDVGPVAGAAAVAEVVKCAPVRTLSWPFGSCERAAGVRWEDIAALDALPESQAAIGEGASAADGTSAADEIASDGAASADEAALPQGKGAVAEKPVAAKPLGLRATLLHQPLWEFDDAQARANWEDVFIPSMSGVLAQLARDVERARGSRAWLAFERLDVVCDRFTIGMPYAVAMPGNVVQVLGQVRQLLADGALGADCARIDFPRTGGWRVVAADGSVQVLR